MVTCLQVEDTSADIRVVPLAHLALTVKVPYRFDKRLQYIRSFTSKDVVHVMRGDDIGLPSFQSACNTQQTYDIRVIGMEILTIRKLSFP